MTVAVSACGDLRRSAKAHKNAKDPSTKTAPQAPRAWPLAALVNHGTAPFLSLRDGQQQAVTVVSTAQLRRYYEVATRLEAVISDIDPIFLLVEGQTPNAFAWVDSGRQVVAVNLAMLEMLDEDADAWAALIGHELAHLKLAHSEQRAERRGMADTAGGAIGIALAVIGIPFGLLLADGALAAVDRGYSRDDERAADGAAVTYMRQAGFDPRGALRFHEMLSGLDKAPSASLLSTHPTGEERVANMRALVEAEAAAAR
jgi:predicted Zn-dependent protease